MKTIQFFSDNYLAQCERLSTEQIVRYLEDFRIVNMPIKKPVSKLISIKIETDLLDAFKTKAHLDGIPYQSRIKAIMRDWLAREG